MTQGLTILHKSVWRQAKPKGICYRCTKPILLVAMQLFRRFKVGKSGWYEREVNPPVRLCCACHEALES